MDDEALFMLPDLGEGLHEAEIVMWLVAPGDRVVADQPLVSIETDKAVLDVPAPHPGRIAQIFGAAGDRIAVGAPLVKFEPAGTAHQDPAAIVGDLPLAPPPSAERARGDAPTSPSHRRIHAAPAVRALAVRLGVDLATVEATGTEGEVLTDDVERAATGPAFEPLRGVRRAMARNMSASGAAVVPATVFDEVDVEAWPAGTDVTARLVRAVVAGCRAAPALNAWFESHAEGRRMHSHVDLGIAVEAPDGLFVPVLRDAGSLEAHAIRAAVDALERAVRSRAVTPEQLRAPTITLSNFGMLAGRHAALVVVPPQVAILGAGRIEPRVVAAAGQPAVHRVLPLSLSFDHRVVTGGEAGAFLAAVIADLARADGSAT